MSGIGSIYGRLTIVREATPRQNACGKRKAMVFAICECGSEKLYQLGNLKSGNSYSCGCLTREALDERNSLKALPQIWCLDGDAAYIELRGRRVLIDTADVALAGQYRWYMDEKGYVDSMQCESMARLLLGLSKGDKREADHKHHVNYDNRRSEIRIATSSQNKQNRRGNAVKTSNFKGVHRDSRNGRYIAQIKAGRHHYLGRFDSEITAAQAYDRAARRYFGEFAHLNFHNDSGVV